MLHFNSHKLKSGLAALIMLMVAGCGSVEDRARTYYESGQEFLKAEDYVSASVEFRNALKLKQDYADAWYGLAKVEEHAQEWPRVYGNLQKALEIDPKHVKALMMQSLILAAAGKPAEAMKNVDTALEVEPSNPDLLALRASIFMKLGDPAGAVTEANKSLAIAKNHPDASLVLVAANLEKGNFDEALGIVQTALADNPKNAGLLLGRVAVFERKRDKVGLEKSLREIIAVFPEERNLRNLLISFLVRDGRGAQAETELRSVLQENPNDFEAAMAVVRFVGSLRGQEAAREEIAKLASQAQDPAPFAIIAAEMDFAAGRKDEAIAQLQDTAKNLGISNRGIEVRLKLAEQLLAVKRNEEAKTVISEILANDAQNVTGLKLRAIQNVTSGNSEEAIEDLRTAVNLDPKSSELRVLLASAYEQGGQIDLSSREFTEGFNLSEFDPDVGVKYAGFLVRRGNADRAHDVLADLAERHPTSKVVLTALGDVLTQKKDWEGVEKIAKSLSALPDDGGASKSLMGTALMGQKRFEAAADILKNSLDGSPAGSIASSRTVQAMIAAGKDAEAEKFVNDMLATKPDNSELLVLKGALLLKRGATSEAKQSYDVAIRVAGGDATGYLALANLATRDGNHAEAEKILLQGVEKSEDKARMQLALAQHYEGRENYDAAIAAYEKALAADQGSLVAVNNLVSLISDHRTDKASLDRAADLAERLRQSPIAAFRETLGWTLVRSGRLKEGLSMLERSILELGTNPVAHYHLGEAYRLSGNVELAAKHLKLAQTLEGGASLKNNIELSLSQIANKP